MSGVGTRRLSILLLAGLLLCPGVAQADAIAPSGGGTVFVFGAAFLIFALLIILVSVIALIMLLCYLHIRDKAKGGSGTRDDGRPEPPRNA